MNAMNIHKHNIDALEPKGFIYNEMKICLENIDFIRFPTNWEEHVLNLLPKKYKQKYFALIQSLLKEIKDIYMKDMQNYIIETVLLMPKKNTDHISVGNCTNYKVLNEKHGFNYNTFIIRCKLLKEKYFLSLEPIKVIINMAQSKLPTIICNFHNYSSHGLISLTDFQHMITSDIKKSLIIINRYYIEVSKAVAKTAINKKKVSSIMQCTTHVFVQQIINMMIGSINHLLNILNDGHHCPQIKFQLILQNNQLLISPSIEEIYSVYHSIINDINTIAQDLVPLEECQNIKSQSRYIKIKLPDWYIKESHNKLDVILCNLFQSINEHVAHITKEFYPIFVPTISDQILSLTSGRVNFDSYLKYIEKYKMYLKKTKEIVRNSYYIVGKLEQNTAKDALKNELHNIVDVFSNKLIKYHQEFNLSICSEFENIKAKALNVPKHAQSLIELNEYVSHASKISVKELECKIQESIHMLSALLEITLLSEDHIELNKKTINWLHEIEPVFKQHHVLCEAMKNELEEDMQSRINDLNSEVDNIVPQLRVLDNMDDINRIEEYIEYYKVFLKLAKRIMHEMQEINEEERLFKFPETEYPKVMELHEIIVPFYDLIYLIYQWQKDNVIWLDGPFEWLDAIIIEQKTLNYLERVIEMSKTFKARIKMDVTVNKCFKFSGIADDPDPMQQPAPLKLSWQALNDINDFKTYLPLVKCVCNPALQKRHWVEMSEICDFDLTPNAGTSLRKIMQLNLMNDIEKYEAISIGANKELNLQQKLRKLIKEWDDISFEIKFNETSGIYKFSNSDDIELLLENHLVIIEEMKTSNFVKPIISTLTDFYMSLIRIQTIINKWNYIQMLICYLDTTFYHPNVKTKLTEESNSYEEIKEILKDTENKLSKTPTFSEINNPVLLNSLYNITGKLERIHEGVQNYIEAKRLCFPRFFFLSDEEIQEVLFKSYDSKILNVSVQRCFQGIKKVKMNEKNCITTIISDYGEEVKLEKFISLHTPNDYEEEWLIHLENEVNIILKKSISQCYQKFSQFSYSRIMNFPSMVIVCVFRLYWTSEMYHCLRPFNFEALKSLSLKYIKHLNDLINELKSYLTQRHRDVLMSLITIVVNQRDIIKLLIDKNITNSTDFEWLTQLHYYLEENCVKVLMFNTAIKYGYEYSYYKQSIINTVLTDRCFHTFIQAYKYHLYGAITGPSATGKTETMKSLANVVAVNFHIFSCANTLSHNFLCQTFKGLISCGAWLCFEHFDELKLEFLSRITQNLICIHHAITTNMKIMAFEGISLSLNPTGYICIITKLGLSKYYDLPNNLKMLFRTVSMVAPDISKIVEVQLFAAGIFDSKSLTAKLITFYKALSEQVYCKSCDTFNLYSAKAVAKTMIYLKRCFPNEDESLLLLRSLIDTNLPQLCSIDVLVFKNIVHSIFPNTALLPPNYSTFLKTLEVICKSKSLHIHDVFKLKILQMFELMYIYKGLILVGDPFVGKTEILFILKDVLVSLYEQGVEFGVNVKLETIIPSAIDTKHIFGYFDDNSKLWKDGICSKMFRSSSESNSSDKTWMVFDGPLSDAWIENLYSALDTSKVLHLESGEQINIVDSVSIIFETMNMIDASPAIVLRCGIIYIESHSVDWRSNIKTHITRHNIYNGHEETLYQLFDWIVNPSLQFIYKHCTLTLIVGKLHCIMSTLNLLEVYLRNAQIENTEEKDKLNYFITWMQVTFILSIIWGLGGNLTTNSHAKFNSFFVQLWSGTSKEYPKPEALKNCDVTLPNEGLIQDNFYIFKGSGHWKHWGSTDLLKNEEILEMPYCNEIFVPTADTIKYNYTLLKHIKHKLPFILCGDTSIGKTCFMKNFLQKKLLEGMYFNSFSFTSLDSVARMQQLLLLKLNKVSKNHYGSPNNGFCINFIDDLNVEMDQCRLKTHNILELFRQYNSCGYFYDINDSEKVFIHNVMFSFAITESNQINICPRFLKHFNLYTMQTPSTNTIFRIFSNVLFINLKKNSFTADVLGTVNSITNATIDIYNAIIKTFLPIPSKFQYQFSIRDISRVINGCNLLQKESVETKVTFVRLWAHEVWRVFGDRIFDNDDTEWLFLKIKEIVKCHFKDSFETTFDYLPKSENNEITKNSFNYLMFNNFIDNNKRYEEINSIEKLKSKVLFYVNEYNNNNVMNKIDIVISQYVLECLIKISRILTIPGGNLLMISAVGSGRKSLMNLAAYIQQQTLFEPSIHSYYDFNMWRTELKRILHTCGGLRKPSILFIKVKHVIPHMFHDISNLLVTGEIPDLFSTEEKYNIIEMVRLHAQGGNKNAEISNHSVMNYFLEQCKNYLHIVICFNSTDKAIRSYLCTYPELLNYCTINWYKEWSTDALTQIGMKYIPNVITEENLKTNTVTASIKLYTNMQEISSKYYEESGKRIHVTSSSFLHMLKLHVNLVSKKQEHIVTMRKKYLIGLEKLELAADQVEKMKVTLTILKPQLELSAEKTVNTMREVENENVSVEKATIVVQREEEVAHKKAEIAGRLKMECEADLAIAIPILEDAVAALNTLKPTDITLVKAMKNPPDAIKLVMAAVCVMLGVPPEKAIDSVTGKKYTDYWSPSKRILSDMNFLQILKDYDKDNISPNIMQVIKKTYITDNNFKPHIVAKASSAAEGLCKWVRAMVSYDEVAKTVAPKKEKWFTAQKECNEAETFLNEKRLILSALNKKLTALNNSLQETLQQKVKLEKEVEDCTNKLHKAENLMASLGSERSRWMQLADNLKKSNDNLIGDMIITCGIISYMASCNIMYRDKIVEYWKQYLEDLKISYTTNYSLVNILGEENEINHWYLCGLPKNRSSLENAIIMNNSELWCLFVDSQNQANQWIKTIEKKNNLKVVRLNDSDYISTILYNIEHGVPTLIENVGEELEISLHPFLLKRTYSNGKFLCLDTGYDAIKYSSDFRLYITTRLLNPQFSCEIFNKLTVINFSISNEGLQDKLLDFIMSKETPELQEKFETLLMEQLDNKKILKQQEAHILNTLSSTTTNILDDEDAIKSLDFSKNLSLNIIQKQEVAKTTSLEIKKSRSVYVQLVKYCANLFDTLNDLSYLNHMYRFSFSWFMQLYRRSIETSNRSTILEKRLKFLKSSFTKNLHISICKSLLERHKLIYSFLLCCKILLDDQQTTEEEIKYFTSSNLNRITPDYIIDWLPSAIWINICNLSKTLSAFYGLADNFHDNDKAWKQYYTSEPLQSRLLPEPWIEKLSLFQKLILIKILRPDKIIMEIMHAIENILETATSSSSPQIKLSQAYAESSCLSPLLFILPACSAPFSLVSAYAKRKGYFSRFLSLSMNRGQEEKAEFLIQTTRKEGGWLLLENCHLVPHWMIHLEKICANCNISNVSVDFRLWLSSYSIKEFPVNIIQDSIKITYDHPLTVKETLLNIYHSEPIVNEEFLESCPGKDIAFSKLLFSLCLFHAVVNERKTFGAQGWNIPYDFDNTDFELSIWQMQNLINNTDHIPFDILLYLIGKCNYGGRIENDFDRRCLEHLLNDYCNPSIINSHQHTYKNEIEKLIPQRCEYDYIIKQIEKIPLDLSPQIFGTNRNSLIIQHTTMAKEFFSSISSMNPLLSLSNEQPSEHQILTLINDLNDKLSNSIKINEIQEQYTSVINEPLGRVLFCEVKVLKYILETIIKTLNNVKLALTGYLPFSDSLKDLTEELYRNKIPHIWISMQNNLITGSLTYYIDNLLKHVTFINKWMNEGCPQNIHFDTLFHCKMFLSAVSLTFSKTHNLPMEETVFDFQVQVKETDVEDLDTYFIHGLHLCGAQWDSETNELIKSFANKFWQSMPPIQLKCSRNKKDRTEMYECPLYKTVILNADHTDKSIELTSKNFIISIPLKSTVHRAHWIKCGTALFCHIP